MTQNKIMSVEQYEKNYLQECNEKHIVEQDLNQFLQDKKELDKLIARVQKELKKVTK